MVDDLYQEIIIWTTASIPATAMPWRTPTARPRATTLSAATSSNCIIKIEGDIVKDASFVGSGCAISTASASLMTESLKGKTREEALKLLEKFHDLLTTDTPVTKDLGKLVVFCGVRDYPARVKCATLAWHTLKSALGDSPDPVTTE
jgi:nitrogen fixation NifU-like protein